MKIIELYGYSCSGKSYAASEIKSRENIDVSFSRISKKNRILRFIIKLSFIFFVKFSDLVFIYNIHKEFKFLNLQYKLKNFFSFLYLVGFMRNSIKKKKSVIIDHGIFQCLFSCYVFAKETNIDQEKVLQHLLEFLNKFPINFNYKIICMKTDMKTIKFRLKKTKKITNLIFLEDNEYKVNETYINLKNISKSISNQFIDFQSI
jgi:hypothetical protein